MRNKEVRVVDSCVEKQTENVNLFKRICLRNHLFISKFTYIKGQRRFWVSRFWIFVFAIHTTYAKSAIARSGCSTVKTIFTSMHDVEISLSLSLFTWTMKSVISSTISLVLLCYTNGSKSEEDSCTRYVCINLLQNGVSWKNTWFLLQMCH